MTHGSLFSGIGGFDLAAQWMGWENVFHCEWNTFGQKVLKHYWPNAIQYHDITKTDFSIHRGTIDVLTGGFPCQPYSMAGKRLGKEDERHLWPEMLRAIREIQPRWVVGENVLGLVNWSGGLVFHEVQADLEAEGYEVQPFVLPACAVNAPHRRDRVWFIAHRDHARDTALRSGNNGNGTTQGVQREQPQFEFSRSRNERIAADSDSSTTRTSGEGGGIKSEGSSVIFQQSERRSETEQHHRPSAFSRNAADTDGIVWGERWEFEPEKQSRHGESIQRGDTKTNGNAAHADRDGLIGSDREHEEQSGKRGFNAQRDIEQGIGDGDFTNSEQSGLQGQHREWEGCSKHRSDKGIFVGAEDKLNAADTERIRLQGRSETGDIQGEKRKASGEGRESPISSEADGEGWVSADTDGIGLRRKGDGIGNAEFISQNDTRTDWQTFPTVSPICHGDDGLSDRLDNITFSKWRQESIKGGGNAVVPQVVLRIFETIEKYENIAHGQT